MKLVLDSNVVVAAFITEGACHELLEHCFLNHEVVLSHRILQEVDEVLREKFKYSKEEAGQVLDLLRSRAALVEPNPLSKDVCRDSDDDWILAAGVAGGCRVIVSGDKDLLEVGEFDGIRIVRPSEFQSVEDEPAS